MILQLDGEIGKRHFEFIFVGFVLGGCLREKKGMQVLRLEVGVFEKLEAISELKPCGKKLANGEPERQLKSTASLQLTPQEFDLLFNYMAEVPWQAGTPSKHALETLDWMNKNGHTS